jgi:hypothetical protein
MILYHYTNPCNALMIGLGAGLKPHCKEDNQRLTMGLPVVWLTKEESNLATEADAKHYAAMGPKLGRDDLIGIGEPMYVYGGPVRCQVEIERSKHVMRYAEFLRTTKLVEFNHEGDRYLTGRDVLRLVEAGPRGAPALTSWWICTRAIPASKIWVPLTRTQAIEACEWHINAHPEADGREQFKQQSDTFVAQPDDMILVLHNGEIQAMERAHDGGGDENQLGR